VISASRDALLKVWDIDSGRCLQTLRGHTHFVYSVSAFDQGRRAISASADKTLKIWDLEEGRELATLEGHAQKVYSVAATQDGRLAVSGSRDRTLRIWNLEKGELAHTLSDHNGRVWSVAISLDGHRAASAAGDGTVKIWDPRVSPIERFPGHAMHVKGVHLSRDSRRALTVSNDSVKLWDVRRGNLLGSRTVGSWISEAHMTPDGRRAVYVSGKGSIRTWDLERNSDLHRLRARAGSVSKALLSERGHYLIVLSAGSTVLEVWRLRNKRSMRVLKKESKVEWQVTPVPYQDLMMVGTGRGPVRLLDPSTGEFRAKSIRERRTSKSIPASGGTRTVLRRGDRRIEVCDWARGVVLASMKFDWENFFLLALAPDGMLAAGSARLVGDNAIRVWDIGNGSLMCKLEGHESDVDTLAITADGRTLVSGSGDQTLRVWDLERGTQEAVFHAESGIEVCAVSADGRTIAAGEDSGRVLFFRLER
jgi:WD40 repeat protein